MTDLFSIYHSDDYKLHRSHTLAAPDDAVYDVIRVPYRGFVKNVWLDITVAYVGGAPSITIGWKGNGETALPSAFMSNAIAAPKVVGTKKAIRDTQISSDGKWFSAAPGIITITVAAGAATTEGTFMVFAEVSVIH